MAPLPSCPPATRGVEKPRLKPVELVAVNQFDRLQLLDVFQ